MMKYLLLIALFAVVWWVWKKRSALPPDRPPADRLPEAMVRCAHCGVHLPESDSVTEGGCHFCNDAHRRAARRMD